MKEKTYVEDIDRNIYDFKYDDKDAYKLKAGLTPEIVEQLSKEKHDPAWMQNFRLESLQIYNNMQVPDWGPSIEGLDIDNIVTYVRPNTKMRAAGMRFLKISRIHLRDLESLRLRENPLRELAHSTIQSSCITMSVRRLRIWELCTLIWRVHSQVSMQTWCRSIS